MIKLFLLIKKKTYILENLLFFIFINDNQIINLSNDENYILIIILKLKMANFEREFHL